MPLDLLVHAVHLWFEKLLGKKLAFQIIVPLIYAIIFIVFFIQLQKEVDTLKWIFVIAWFSSSTIAIVLIVIKTDKNLNPKPLPSGGICFIDFIDDNPDFLKVLKELLEPSQIQLKNFPSKQQLRLHILRYDMIVLNLDSLPKYVEQSPFYWIAVFEDWNPDIHLVGYSTKFRGSDAGMIVGVKPIHIVNSFEALKEHLRTKRPTVFPNVHR